MKKGFLAVTLATSIFALSACGNQATGMDDAIVTSDVGDITVGEFYDQLKTQNAASSLLQQMVTLQVFTEKFEVSDDEVEAELETYREQLGDQFEAALQQAGYADEDAFKDVIRGDLAMRKAVEKSITEDELKEAADTLQVEASHILVEDEDTAKEMLQKLDDGEDFADLATEYSKDTGSAANGGQLGFFNENTGFVDEFWQAAKELKVGEISEPVESDHGWHIIKVTDRKEPRNLEDLSDDEVQELKDSIVDEKFNDGSVQDIINATLKEANVKVNDDTFKGLFDFSDNSSEE